MAMRFLSLLLAMWALLPCSPAQTSTEVPAAAPAKEQPLASPDSVIRVLRTRIGGPDAANRSVAVEVDVLDLSSQIITACGYTVSATYSDGSQTVSHESVDDVTPVLAQRLNQNVPDSAFRPGTRKTLELRLPIRAGGNMPVSASVTITTAVLADRTAYGSSNEARRIGSRRQKSAADLSRIADELQALKDSPFPAKAVADRILEIQKQDPTTLSKITNNPLLLVLRTLSASLQTDGAAIERAIALYRTHAQVLLEQASLDGGTAQ